MESSSSAPQGHTSSDNQTSVLSDSPCSVASNTPRGSSSKRVRKQCSHRGCTKVDAGGGSCVAHGGGKKCSFEGCTKGYQTGGFCRQHGGGARCQIEGCGKVDAGKGLCRAHGGGKRCQVDGCSKADVGGGFCTAHGGGKRCDEPGCTKINQGGGKCRAHGGAKRCYEKGCDQPARGTTGLCSAHGGAQLCIAPNCRRLVKIKGNTYCLACTQERTKATEEGQQHEQNNKDTVDKEGNNSQLPIPSMAAMPPFASLLACANGYSDMTEETLTHHDMEQFHAFVITASTVQSSNHSRPEFSLSSLSSAPHHHDGAAAAGIDQSVESVDDDTSTCLENGCSKSFGGRCNCKAGCTCCSRARAAEHVPSSSCGSLQTVTKDDGTPQPVGLPQPCITYLALQRVQVRILSSSNVSADLLRAIVQALPDVRSVHAQPNDGTAMDQDESQEEAHRLIVRGNPGFTVTSLETLSRLSIRYNVEETSTIDWAPKEIVLQVDDMMCPGNCGRTVVNALQQVGHCVSSAHLAFEQRCVAVRGVMYEQELCDAVDATGFEAVVVSVTPWARQFWFRVNDLASAFLLGDRLRGLLLDVEGVENVVLLVERAEVLVQATLENAEQILAAADGHGIMMVEIPATGAIAAAASLDPTRSSRVDTHAHGVADGSSGDDASHVCDVAVCAHNGCERYMVTVAHTAAIAVGWSVPGCGMSWGGECTCGDSCKCKGCPQHNPAS